MSRQLPHAKKPQHVVHSQCLRPQHPYPHQGPAGHWACRLSTTPASLPSPGACKLLGLQAACDLTLISPPPPSLARHGRFQGPAGYRRRLGTPRACRALVVHSDRMSSCLGEDGHQSGEETAANRRRAPIGDGNKTTAAAINDTSKAANRRRQTIR